MVRSILKVGAAQPSWLSMRKPTGKKLASSSIVKKHLKEWNYDEPTRDLAKEEDIKEEKEFLKHEKDIDEYDKALTKARLKRLLN